MLDPHAESPAMFHVRPDPRCLRGLRFVYAVPSRVTQRLIAGVRAAFPRHLVETIELWGPATVHRLVVQFRFELQLGPHADELLFTHRVTAVPAQRAHDRAWFELTLLAASAQVAL